MNPDPFIATSEMSDRFGFRAPGLDRELLFSRCPVNVGLTMNGERIKPRRVLGVAHILVGVASFVPAAMYALFLVAPLVLGPIWFCVLGVWLWRST